MYLYRPHRSQGFPCKICTFKSRERTFKSQTDLEEHYRGSPNHPNCSICGRGFRDQVLCDTHHDDAHPRVVCSICKITLYEHKLPQHFKDSPRHPTCDFCPDAPGFENDAAFALHCEAMHTEFYCVKCRRVFDNIEGHYLNSVVHPTCERCEEPVGFVGEKEYTEHVKTTHLRVLKPALKFTASPTHLSYPDTNEQDEINEAMVRKLVDSEELPPTVRPQFVFNPFDDDYKNAFSDPHRSHNNLISSRDAPSLLGCQPPSRNLSVHCRSCLANPCHETTATTCGHIFCKRCITENIASTSRCPVCGEMTLLYMLFKLYLD